MRVVVYTEDYEPMTVRDMDERDIDDLRAMRGDTVQLAAMHPADYRAAPEVVEQQRLTRFSVLVTVEGMEWADGRTRYIIVLHGLHSREFRGRDIHRMADAAVAEARSMSRRYRRSYEAPRMYGYRTDATTATALTMEMVNRAAAMMEAQNVPQEIFNALQVRMPDMVGGQVGQSFMAEAVRSERLGACLINPAAAWPYPAPARTNDVPADDTPTSDAVPD